MNTLTHNTLLRDFATMTNAMNKFFAQEPFATYNYAQNGGSLKDHTQDNGKKITPNNLQSPTTARLPLDTQVLEDAFVFTAYLPGVKPEELEITFEKDELTIKGQFQAKSEGNPYLKQELYHGPFARTVSFGAPVDSDATEAHFENGVLTLHVPKAEVAKPKKIAVVAK